MHDIEKLRGLDYSHPYVTDVEHIIALYRRAKSIKALHALDIGTFQGHSAIALALAGANVLSVDLDSKPMEESPNYELACELILLSFKKGYGYETIEKCYNVGQLFDIIMHDSEHGEHVVPELNKAWLLIANEGILAVHDVDQINVQEFIKGLHQLQSYEILIDGKGRQLLFAYKT